MLLDSKYAGLLACLIEWSWIVSTPPLGSGCYEKLSRASTCCQRCARLHLLLLLSFLTLLSSIRPNTLEVLHMSTRSSFVPTEIFTATRASALGLTNKLHCRGARAGVSNASAKHLPQTAVINTLPAQHWEASCTGDATSTQATSIRTAQKRSSAEKSCFGEERSSSEKR